MSSLFGKQWAATSWRAATFVAAFGCASKLVWTAGGHLVSLSGAQRLGTGLDLPPVVAKWQNEFAKDPSPRKVAMLGDSMLFPLPGLRSVPDRVDWFLRRERVASWRASVHPLTFPVFWVISQYCAVDEVLRAKPDVVVLELNLRSLEPGPLGGYSYGELAGWIDWRRIPEALLLPLGDAGLTANRILFYRMLVSLRLERAWEAVIDRQARFLNSRDPLEIWIYGRVGGMTTAAAGLPIGVSNYRRFTMANKNRGTSYWLRAVLGTALGGADPHLSRLRVLGPLVERFRDAGVPTLVWVSPTNVEHLRSVGIDVQGLARTVRSAQAVVEAHGGAFVDLHAALADVQFRDPADHFTLDGDGSGGAALAPRLANAIVKTYASSLTALPERREIARAVQ